MTAPTARPPATPLTRPRLVPVVEFEPSPYAREQVSPPERSGREDEEAWRRYWEQSLASSGLHLEPVYPGSWLVPVSRLTEPHVLRELLRVQLSHVDDTSPDLPAVEQVTSMAGGHVLYEAGDLILSPRCCGELKDLRSWDDAAHLRLLKPESFWIGHPQVFASWEEPWLVLREDEPDREGVRPEYPLSREALSQAVQEARKEQEDLAQRLEPLLRERFPPETARLLARELTGLV